MSEYIELRPTIANTDATEDIDVPDDGAQDLLTDRETEILSKGKDHPDVDANHDWVTRSRVRKKAERLVDEFSLIVEEVPDTPERVRDGVCDE